VTSNVELVYSRRQRVPVLAAAWALAVALGGAMLAAGPAMAVELDLTPQVGTETGRTQVQYFVPFDCSAIDVECEVEVSGFRRGKRLEVKNISCYTKVDGGGSALFFVAATIGHGGDTQGLQFFPATFITETTTRIFTGGGQTFFLVGPRATLYIRTTADKDITETECTIAGDLVSFN
jgi:hypothetical protein